MRTECNGQKCNFHAHPWFNGAPWYDWGYIAYMIADENGGEVLKHYPSLILGFVQIDDEEVMAVVRTSVEDLPWNKRLQDFVSSFHIGTNFEEDYTLVPVSAITHPLFVFKDYEGEHTKFFCTLPKRNWAQYFNSKIDDSNELIEEEEENTVNPTDSDEDNDSDKS